MSQQHQQLKQRDVGLDIVRMVSMYLIVLLHMATFTRLLKLSSNLPYHKYVTDMDFFGVTGVPTFCLLSGYLSHRHQLHTFKLFVLDMQVRFYELVTWLWSCYRTDNHVPFRQEWMRIAFPVACGNYWYIQRYFVLLFMQPILNNGLRVLTNKALCVISGVFVLHLGAFSFLTAKYSDMFVNESYYYFLLIGLYVVGATLSRISTHWKTKPTMVISALGIVLGFFFNRFNQSWLATQPNVRALRPGLVQHATLPAILTAISILMFFSKIRMHVPTWLERILRRNSAAVLAVFLIHHNPRFRPLMWRHFHSSQYPKTATVCLIQAYNCAKIFWACWLFDFIRQLLFHPLEQSAWLSKFFATKIDPIFNPVAPNPAAEGPITITTTTEQTTHAGVPSSLTHRTPAP